MGSSERQREIRRRRHRKKKMGHYRKKLESANASDRQQIAHKIWQLTPGAPVVIKTWDLQLQ